MAAHCPDQILSIGAHAKIQFLVQRENLEMIVVGGIAVWRAGSFIADVSCSGVRPLPKSHGIFQTVQIRESFTQFADRGGDVPDDPVDNWRGRSAGVWVLG